MKNQLISLKDKILLRKRSVIETVNDELKNICQVEHSRNRLIISSLIPSLLLRPIVSSPKTLPSKLTGTTPNNFA